MRFFLIILCSLSFLTVNAQEIDSTRLYPRAVGVNAFFVNSFLPLDNDIGLDAPYLVSLRKYKPNQRFTHQGFNIDLFGVFDEPEDEPKQNSNNIDLGYRIGWGKHWTIQKKIVMYAGGDLLLEGRLSQTKTFIESNFSPDGVNKRRIYTFRTGGGPFVGVQYNFSPRFGVYTEASYYLKFSYENEKFTTDIDGQSDFTNKQFRYFDIFKLPGSITLFFNY